MTIAGVTASAVSALTANATRVAAVADNVANVGTVGFKATDVRTTTLVTGQGAGGGFAAGGVQTVARPSVAVQGLLESSNSPTDLAVAGTAREGGAGGPPFAVDVVFNGDGSLQGFDTDQDGAVDGGTPPVLHVDGLSTGGADLDITLDLGSAGGLDELTQFSGGFTLGFIDSDGARFGTVSGVDIASDGSVTALFDNGESRAIYQIPLATFANPDGLQAKTGNVFAETAASGQALLGTPGSGANGTVQAGALEQSNVDLAGEFANLIQASVAYGFAVAVLRTADETFRTLLDIKV